MTRVLVIGIDALDAVMLSKYEAELPNLSRLKRGGPEIKLESVQPPDSDTAWASIYTGLNPAKHGIVHFVDPLEKAYLLAAETKDNKNLRHNTYWDRAGKSGRKVCVILPHLGYPIWSVNGVMIGRSAGNIQAFPPSIARQHDLSKLSNVAGGFPGRAKELKRFVAAHKRLISDEAEFGLEMLGQYEWDLFFIYFSSLDIIQHFLWKYCDEDDPTYPGDNPYKETIKDFYKLCDDIVGKFISRVEPETAVVVLSDHGHGRRPTKLVNLNEFLRQHGLLVARAGGRLGRARVNVIENLKKYMLRFVNKYELGGFAQKIMRLLPGVRKVYTSPSSIDWQRTTACLSDLSGIKAYSYGGIIISQDKVKGKEYEELRSWLLKELSAMKDPETGDKLMNWAVRREELYQGQYISSYPDIIFELKEDYGAGWAVYDSLVGPGYAHSFVPGSHKAASPVVLMANLGDRQVARQEMTLMDFAPSILDLLGVEGDNNFDGRSIFRD